MSLQSSPLDAVTASSGPRWSEFGGWEMPICVPVGHDRRTPGLPDGGGDLRRSPPRHRPARAAPTPSTRSAAALTNDLDQDRARARAVHPPARRRRRLGGRRHHRVVASGATTDEFDVMPNASNTDGSVDALGGADVTSDRAVLAVQGPDGAGAAGARCSPRPRRSGGSGSTRRLRTAPVHGRRHRVHRGARRRDRRPRRRPRRLWRRASPERASRRPVSALATRSGSRPALPLHGHELGPGITSLKPASAGSWLGQARVPRPEAARAERDAGISPLLFGIVTDGRRPARAECAVSIDGSHVGDVTSGNFSPVLGHGIAFAFLPPDTPEGRQVMIDVRGKELAGQVVSTPFVTR